MKNKITVTIGIPAYNEEANIRNLLESLLAQKARGYKLKEIIVVSDGSNDRTVSEARRVKDKRIRVIEKKQRRGQALSQNSIFERANSDFVVLLNADTLIKRDNFLAKMVEAYNSIQENPRRELGDELNADMSSSFGGDVKKPRPLGRGGRHRARKNVGIVASGIKPLPSDSYLGKVLGWHKIWKRKLYENLSEGDNILLCHGRARGFSRQAYENIRWPKVWPEDAYSYLAIKKLGLGFVYCKAAVAYYRSPQTFKDHSRQSIRFLLAEKALAPYFSKQELKKAYTIPKKLFISSAFRGLIKNPVKAVSYLAIYFYCKLLALSIRQNDDHTLWESSKSTKILRSKIS